MSGQSLIEFALCSFLFTMLLIGVVEIGRMVLVYTTISNAARAGTRYAIVHGTDNAATPTNIRDVVRAYLGAAPMTTADANIGVCYGTLSVSCTCTSTTGAGSTATIGSAVVVQVCYPFDPITTYFPLTVTLASQSEGVITF